VVDTIAYLAELRAWSVEESRERVWANYAALTGCVSGHDALLVTP
jgi:hypothetical protein